MKLPRKVKFVWFGLCAIGAAVLTIFEPTPWLIAIVFAVALAIGLPYAYYACKKARIQHAEELQNLLKSYQYVQEHGFTPIDDIIY